MAYSKDQAIETHKDYSETINNWEYSEDGGTIWNNIANTTSSNSYLNLTGTTLYRASVQNGVCPADFSDTVTITIDSLSLGGNVTSNITVCSGNNSDSLFLSGNRGSVLNWEFSTDGGFIWSSIVNDTTFQIFNNVPAIIHHLLNLPNPRLLSTVY